MRIPICPPPTLSSEYASVSLCSAGKTWDCHGEVAVGSIPRTRRGGQEWLEAVFVMV